MECDSLSSVVGEESAQQKKPDDNVDSKQHDGHEDCVYSDGDCAFNFGLVLVKSHVDES